MASEYHLRLLYKAEFHDVFDRYHRDPEFSALLHRMKVVNEHGESQMDEDQWSAASAYLPLFVSPPPLIIHLAVTCVVILTNMWNRCLCSFRI